MFTYYLIGMGVLLLFILFKYKKIVLYIRECTPFDITKNNDTVIVIFMGSIILVFYPIIIIVVPVWYLIEKLIIALVKANKRIIERESKRK